MKKYQYLASWDDQTLTRVGEPVVVLGDSNVSQVEVTLPSNFLLDPTKAECRMYFLLPGEKESAHDVLETAVKDENGDSHVTWTIKHVHSQKGGRLAFSLTLIGDNVQWDSRTAIIPVYESRYQPESEEAEKPYTGRLDALEGSMASIRGEFAEVQDDFEELKETATLGTPIPESLVANMQEGHVYIYTGTEPGYTAGHVYYYVNGALTDGGQYGGTAVDATLAQSGQAADAKVTGDEIATVKEDLSVLLVSDPLTVPIGQGGISYKNGSESNDTNRCRSTIYVSFTGYALKVVPKAGYKVGTRIYTGTTVSQFTGYIGFMAEAFEINDNTKYYKFVIGRTDDADITPEGLPDDVVTFSNIGTDKTLTGDNKIADAKATGDAINNIKAITETALSSNTEALSLVWEQGTYNVNTGGKNAFTNRIRTKYKVSLNSLSYLVMYCPAGWLLSGRRYTQNNEQTYLGTIPAFTGMKLFKHTEHTMYAFIVRKDDDTDITPADIPAEIKIIPVYLPYWDANAHGNSVATFRTTRNNPLYVRQLCDVAETYYEHRSDSTDGVADMQYGFDSATRVDTYTRQIDCSTFVTLCLLGIPYTDTQYYTKTDTPASSLVPNPQYAWSVDPRLYDYYPDDLTGEPNGGGRASQLAEWMIDMGWRVPKDKKLLNLEVGDILFYARTNETGSQLAQPDRFMCINHIAICTDKQRNTSGTGFPYTYTLTEVTKVTPCVRKKVVEDGWNTPDVINVNNYNTLVLICRPDLGSI